MGSAVATGLQGNFRAKSRPELTHYLALANSSSYATMSSRSERRLRHLTLRFVARFELVVEFVLFVVFESGLGRLVGSHRQFAINLQLVARVAAAALLEIELQRHFAE